MSEDLKLDPVSGSVYNMNHIVIRCTDCSANMIIIRSSTTQSHPSLEIQCKRIDLTCKCGKVHSIINDKI